jgi:hypothetical protein
MGFCLKALFFDVFWLEIGSGNRAFLKIKKVTFFHPHKSFCKNSPLYIFIKRSKFDKKGVFFELKNGIKNGGQNLIKKGSKMGSKFDKNEYFLRSQIKASFLQKLSIF